MAVLDELCLPSPLVYTRAAGLHDTSSRSSRLGGQMQPNRPRVCETPQSEEEDPNSLLGAAFPLVSSSLSALLVQRPNPCITIGCLLICHSQQHLIWNGLGVIKGS